MKHSNTTKTFAFAAVTALALAIAPAAKAQVNKGCTNATLTGHLCLHSHRVLYRRARTAGTLRRNRCANLRRARGHYHRRNVKYQRQHNAGNQHGHIYSKP